MEYRSTHSTGKRLLGILLHGGDNRCTEGADGGTASVKMNKGDEGYHIRLWFEF